MDVLAALLPLVLVIVLMTKPKPWGAHTALGLAAALAYVIQLVHFAADPLGVHAAVIAGLIAALTPLSIVAGAILLFRMMGAGGAIAVIRTWLNGISSNPVAQLMVIGWAFVFLIEGASGFGTPAALAAPVLVALGFAPVHAAIFCLVCDTVPTSFGAVGTPTWFGFSELALGPEQLAALSWKTAVVQGAAALVVPVVGLRLLLPWAQIRRNLGFIYASILACVLPYLAVAAFSSEFPALVGGAVGLVVSVLLARQGIGLRAEPAAEPASDEEPAEASAGEAVGLDAAPPKGAALLRAFAPLALVVLILVITRLPQLPFKGWLTSGEQILTASLGSLGQFSLSESLIIKLQDIIGTSMQEGYKLLYVPALIPFLVVALLCLPILRMRPRLFTQEVRQTGQQLARPALALFAALIFVKLMMMGGDRAATAIIGAALAEVAGSAWPLVASLLGALGSFFSGSATVSNLTFGPIQDAVAQQLSLDRTTILALQSAGGALGNMICLHNIVAVCTVLNLQQREGYILTRTIVPMLIYALVVGLVGLAL